MAVVGEVAGIYLPICGQAQALPGQGQGYKVIHIALHIKVGGVVLPQVKPVGSIAAHSRKIGLVRMNDGFQVGAKV